MNCRVCKEKKPESDFYKTYGYTRKICKKCETSARAALGRRRKKEAVALLGGKCEECGYDKCIQALEFDHLENKSFEPSEMFKSKSWKTIIGEIKKCRLLCANCHREKTFSLQNDYLPLHRKATHDQS